MNEKINQLINFALKNEMIKKIIQIKGTDGMFPAVPLFIRNLFLTISHRFHA